MDRGAPNPIILSDENRLSIAFYLNSTADDWDGTTCKMRNPKADNETIAIVNIAGVYQFSQRPNGVNHNVTNVPYDLYESVWEIENSEKVKQLTDQHSFLKYKHLIFGFHDTTIECLCSDYSVVHIESTVHDAIDLQMDFVFGIDTD